MLEFIGVLELPLQPDRMRATVRTKVIAVRQVNRGLDMSMNLWLGSFRQEFFPGYPNFNASIFHAFAVQMLIVDCK